MSSETTIEIELAKKASLKEQYYNWLSANSNLGTGMTLTKANFRRIKEQRHAHELPPLQTATQYHKECLHVVPAKNVMTITAILYDKRLSRRAENVFRSAFRK